MKAIITIIGKDKTGIVYKISELMYKYNINIIDISQTIMDDYFTMIMMADITDMNVDFTTVVKGVEKLGEELGLYIKMQHQDIFDAMQQL